MPLRLERKQKHHHLIGFSCYSTMVCWCISLATWSLNDDVQRFFDFTIKAGVKVFIISKLVLKATTNRTLEHGNMILINLVITQPHSHAGLLIIFCNPFVNRNSSLCWQTTFTNSFSSTQTFFWSRTLIIRSLLFTGKLYWQLYNCTVISVFNMRLLF